MNGFTGISVIIPTIDEIEDVKEVVSIILSTCKKEDISDISLIYSPFSDDGFVNYLHSLKELYPDTVFNIACQPGRGVGDAVRYGITLSRGSHIVMIGADMENDPHDISVMARLSKEHPDKIITGSRNLHKEGFSEYPRIKTVINRAFQLFLKIFFRTKGTDVTYLFQSTPIDIIKEHKFLCPEAFVLELALLAETKKLPSIEFPSKVYRRQHGSSHLTFRYYLGFIKAVFRIFFKSKKE